MKAKFPKHLWIVAAIVSFLLPERGWSAGACTCARFNDFKDHGCHKCPGGAGAPPSGADNAGSNKASCPTCPPPNGPALTGPDATDITTGNLGMPRWWVDEPYINLHIVDEPLSYTTSSGEPMTFRFMYKQGFSIPSPDQIPSLYTSGSQNARGNGEIYMCQMRGYGVLENNAAWPGMMTNAAWSHNWMMNIMFWDSNWETYVANYRTTPPGYQVYQDGYNAMVFTRENGVDYFTCNTSSQSLNPSTMLTDPLTQEQLVSSGLNNYPVAGTPTADANGIYWGTATNGFKLLYPDGSQDVFGLTFYSGAGLPFDTTAEAMLTQRIDPQGRKTLLGYEQLYFQSTCYYVDGVGNYAHYTAYRLKYVVDSDGRTNTFQYNASSPSHPWQVAEIDDPFGRKATFTYGSCTNGMLESITDAAGLINSFSYLSGVYWTTNLAMMGTNFVPVGFANPVHGGITNLATPYGNTTFYYYQQTESDVTNGVQQRAIDVTEPDSASQLFAYIHNTSSSVEANASAPVVPGLIFDDGSNGGGPDQELYHRNSFYWDRRQTAALSPSITQYLPGNLSQAITNLASSAADLRKARMQHWLLDPNDFVSITEAISSERAPSQDGGGAIAGQRTWYSYGDNTPADEFSSDAVAAIAQILPDGSSQYTRYSYYSTGLVANNEQSYSLPAGGVGELTNWFNYAANGVDLTGVSNSLGQSINIGYNASHQVLSMTNALGQVTTRGWDPASHNLTNVAYANGQTISLGYYPSNTAGHIYNTNSFLSGITVQPEGRFTGITDYTNALPRIVHMTATGVPDLWLTNSWDGLNRLTGAIFQDGTTISNIYAKLDIVAKKDRLGNWTRYGYDGLQHLLAVTNALTNITRYGWCNCGSLTSISNALGNTTWLNYNNQELLTNVNFPDGSSMNWRYDPSGRMTNQYDGLGNSQQYAYNNQDQIISVSNVYGQLFGAYYDAVGRPLFVTNANGVVVNNSFDLLNRLTTRSWLGGGFEAFGYASNGLIAYTNQDSQWTHFSRDAASRLIALTNALQTNQFAYDGLNHLISLTDGLSHTTGWNFNQYGWLTSKANTLGATTIAYTYDADGRVTNRWMMGTNTGYAYDAIGNLTNIAYPAANIAFKYDAINEPTNMSDMLGTTAFTWTSNRQLASETGPWPGDTLTYAYTQGHRTSLSLSQPSGTNWTQTYTYDPSWRTTAITTPAGTFSYGYAAVGPRCAAAQIATIALPNTANITNSYDPLARLTSTALLNQWSHILDGYAYGMDLLGLRTNLTRELGLTTNNVSISYDPIAEVTSWTAKEANGTPRQNEQLAYAYDAGNNLRQRTNNALAQTFTVNALNQISNITRTGTLTVSGSLPAPATNVTVNGAAAQTNADFTFASPGNNLANGTNTYTILAQNIYGVTATNTLSVNLPATVNFQYDANGNLTNDGTRSFQYDAENQLTNVTVTGQWKAGYLYDGFGRRRIRRAYIWQSGAWSLTNETHYIYDGPLVVQERDTNDNVLVTYTRGLDLSGSLFGAGGIGGLLARTDTNGTTYYHSDGNGNVTAMIDANGNIVARYEYDAFGRLIGMWGPLATANAYRFSSKEYDPLTGLYYYGLRYYDPVLQRWLNRDPIGELGGVNLYQAMRNNPMRWVDPYGLDNMYNTSAGQNAPPSMNFSGSGDGPITVQFQGGQGDPFLALMAAEAGIGIAGGAIWGVQEGAAAIGIPAQQAALIAALLGEQLTHGSANKGKKNDCSPKSGPGAQPRQPMLGMAQKPDIKQIKQMAKEFEMTREQHRDFGDYVEDQKRATGRGPAENFSWSELTTLAEEFMADE